MYFTENTVLPSSPKLLLLTREDLTMKEKHLHLSHLDVIKRLRRAQGHLKGTIDTLENGHHSCSELAQQLYAVEKAIANAKKLLIHDHIDHCLEHSVDESPQDTKSMVQEFKHISKYL